MYSHEMEGISPHIYARIMIIADIPLLFLNFRFWLVLLDVFGAYSERIGGAFQNMILWMWFILCVAGPIIAQILLLIFTFIRSWESRALMMISVSLCGLSLFLNAIFLPIGNGFVLPRSVAAATIIYLACIQFPKIPYRKWIGSLVIAALSIFFCVQSLRFGDADVFFENLLFYVSPLLPYLFTAHLMPETWD